jgi:hypothetical protein
MNLVIRSSSSRSWDRDAVFYEGSKGSTVGDKKTTTILIALRLSENEISKNW